MAIKKFKVLITTECEVELPEESHDSRIIISAFSKLNADIQFGFTSFQFSQFTAKVIREDD